MKTEIETTVPRSSHGQLRPAPSLRVPVTARNRDFLRWLRAAELAAWEAGEAGVHVSHGVFTRTATMPTPLHH